MAQVVPASTKVHYKRVHNVDTDRLQRRLAWLQENKGRLAREIDSVEKPGGRPTMRQTAREIITIERELARRFVAS